MKNPEVYDLLSTSMQQLADRVRQSLIGLGHSKAVHHEVFEFEHGPPGYLAYISCGPSTVDPHDNVEVTYQVVWGDHELYYDADVVWTSGRIITELDKTHIPFTDGNDLISTLHARMQEVEDVAVQRVVDTLLEAP